MCLQIEACDGYCKSQLLHNQRSKKSFQPHRSERYLSKQISKVLDQVRKFIHWNYFVQTFSFWVSKGFFIRKENRIWLIWIIVGTIFRKGTFYSEDVDEMVGKFKLINGTYEMLIFWFFSISKIVLTCI